MVPQFKESQKAQVSRLSHEERTPKKLKALEPDCTVVCGGEEFYHYKALLCSGSDFFDTMLSHEMKEKEESRIVLFPDKDPREWLEIYAFIEPTKDGVPLITADNAKRLVSWFSFLQMHELVYECDKVYAKSLKNMVKPYLDSFETYWNEVKGEPSLVNSQAVVLSALTNFLSLFQRPYGFSPSFNQRNSTTFYREGGMNADEAKKLKALILDNVGGERVLQTVKSGGYLSFPPEALTMSRVELANNPLFVYLLQMSHRRVGEA